MGERKAKNFEALQKEQEEKLKERGKSKSELKKEKYKQTQTETRIKEREILKAAEEREETRKEKEAVAKAAKKIEGKKTVKSKTRRSGRYQKVRTLVDRTKQYSIDEALEILPKISMSKFEGTCEIHIHIDQKLKKGQEAGLRGRVKLLHGTGKKLKIVVIDEEMATKIEGGWTDFDVALATPEMMPKIARLAKILGPRGKMPNPKAGTVTADPQKTIKELGSGVVEYRTDAQNIIHLTLGKISWPKEKLKENFEALMSALPQNRILSAHLAPTIGPSVKLKV